MIKSVIKCEKCDLPIRGGLTGKSYCICDDIVLIRKIRNSMKSKCVSCGNEIEKSLKRYIDLGNYCNDCSRSRAKMLTYEKKKSTNKRNKSRK